MVAAVQLWAEALAEKGTVGPEETDDLLELLFKDNSDAEHSQQQSCPAGSGEKQTPLCAPWTGQVGQGLRTSTSGLLWKGERQEFSTRPLRSRPSEQRGSMDV